MRDFSTPRVYIFSAHKASQGSIANHFDHCDLSCDLALAGFPFRECEGSYKGVREKSYIVTGAAAGPTVHGLARLHKQESYLVVTEHDRTAYLVDPASGYHTHLGRFVAYGDTEPECDAWTLCDGVYFVVTPTAGPDLPEGL